jgi:hypothetical protein
MQENNCKISLGVWEGRFIPYFYISTRSSVPAVKNRGDEIIYSRVLHYKFECDLSLLFLYPRHVHMYKHAIVFYTHALLWPIQNDANWNYKSSGVRK